MALLPVGSDPRWRPAIKTTKFVRRMSPKWSGQDRVTKILTLHPVLISGMVNSRPFKFYTELNREKYNNIYIYRNLGIM